MSELLQEYCDCGGMALRVDRAGGVIRGIKILGLHSRNNRQYQGEALARAVGLYEGAKVNVNHPKGHPLAPRDYQERIGIIRNVQHRTGDGLFADFHFNPKHYLSEQLSWDAEHAPENVGFSHNVQARTARHGETTVVEEILRVQSVDLVADPATTRGLFESAESVAMMNDAEDAKHDRGATENENEAFDSKPSPWGEGRVRGSFFAAHAPHPDPLPKGEREQPDVHLMSLNRQLAEEVARLQTELDTLRAADAADKRRTLIRQLLAEYHLPDAAATQPDARAIVSEAFLQSLLAAPSDKAVRQLVEERSRLIGSARSWIGTASATSGRPMSRDQYVPKAESIGDSESFVRAIAG